MKLKKIAACVAVPSLAFSLVSCGEDAVSKEQFSQGYLKLVKQSQKIHGKQQEEYVIRFGECIYDKIKDKVKNSTLEKVKNVKRTRINSNDFSRIEKAQKDCKNSVSKPKVTKTN